MNVIPLTVQKNKPIYNGEKRVLDFFSVLKSEKNQPLVLNLGGSLIWMETW